MLAHILYDVVSDHWAEGLQVAVVAEGPFTQPFHEIVARHGFLDRVAVCAFDERISHLGYAASDFILMPSRFEPCGLPQMIGCAYGSLPIVHDTGGLHDTVSPLDVSRNTGNGFVFETYDPGGLRWAIDQAMAFYRLPPEARRTQLARVLTDAAQRFNHGVTAQRYFKLYERMLERPLV